MDCRFTKWCCACLALAGAGRGSKCLVCLSKGRVTDLWGERTEV